MAQTDRHTDSLKRSVISVLHTKKNMTKALSNKQKGEKYFMLKINYKKRQYKFGNKYELWLTKCHQQILGDKSILEITFFVGTFKIKWKFI